MPSTTESEGRWSPRIQWHDLPAHVQSGIEDILGSPVEEAMSQEGGFSPGSADRVRTVSGARAFVKTAGRALNEHSAGIHRKEAAIASAIPPGVPAPGLLGTYDDGEWVALVFTDVEGRHPATPWRPGEADLVLDALLTVARTELTPELAQLPRLEAELADPFSGWSRIRDNPPDGCDAWVLRNLDLLEALAGQGLHDIAGDALVHADLRADNILITAEGAVLVDWPWAAIGAAWVDAVTVLVNIRLFDPSFDVDSLVRSHDAFAGASPGKINGLLSGLAAFFLDSARQPAPAGLPTLRAFQFQQGGAVIHWLRERLAVG